MRNKAEIEQAIKKPDFNWLGRKTFIEDFIKHLKKLPVSSHICINGVWGSGKTTTILGIIKYLREKDKQNPLVIYLDAWKYEHYQHPIFALLKLVQEELPEIFDIIKDDFQKRGIKLQAGLNLPSFNLTMAKNEHDPYNRFLNESEYIDVLNKMMIEAVKKIKEERSNELVVFIDELDRAKPDFALRTIEMFHHLQDELPTHIVYSVDMNQLSSIIKHYYGYEYNVEIFTHKVFDEVISLKKLSKDEIAAYIDLKFETLSVNYNITNLRELMMKYMNHHQLESLRSINKVCESIVPKLQSGYFKPDQDGFFKFNYYLGRNRNYNLWGYVELLIALEVFMLIDSMKVYEFLRSENINELLNFIQMKEMNNDRKELEDLIAASYNYDKEKEEHLSYSELTEEEKIIGIRKLFVPITREYGSESVFSSGEIF